MIPVRIVNGDAESLTLLLETIIFVGFKKPLQKKCGIKYFHKLVFSLFQNIKQTKGTFQPI